MKTWFCEALALTVRKPLSFVILTLAMSAMNLLPGSAAGLAFLLFTPMFLGLGCRLAHQSDIGEPSLPALTGLSVRALMNLVLIGALGLAVFLAGIGFVLALWHVLYFLFSYSTAPAPVAGPPIGMLFEGGAAVVLWSGLWIGLSSGTLWCLAPLCSQANMSLGAALDQCFQALAKNPFLVSLSWSIGAASIVLSFLSVVMRNGLIAVVAFPFICCLIYVSYRHIWWNRRKNEPARRVAPVDAQGATSLPIGQ